MRKTSFYDYDLLQKFLMDQPTSTKTKFNVIKKRLAFLINSEEMPAVKVWYDQQLINLLVEYFDIDQFNTKIIENEVESIYLLWEIIIFDSINHIHHKLIKSIRNDIGEKNYELMNNQYNDSSCMMDIMYIGIRCIVSEYYSVIQNNWYEIIPTHKNNTEASTISEVLFKCQCQDELFLFNQLGLPAYMIELIDPEEQLKVFKCEGKTIRELIKTMYLQILCSTRFEMSIQSQKIILYEDEFIEHFVYDNISSDILAQLSQDTIGKIENELIDALRYTINVMKSI